MANPYPCKMQRSHPLLAYLALTRFTRPSPSGAAPLITVFILPRSNLSKSGCDARATKIGGTSFTIYWCIKYLCSSMVEKDPRQKVAYGNFVILNSLHERNRIVLGEYRDRNAEKEVDHKDFDYPAIE